MEPTTTPEPTAPVVPAATLVKRSPRHFSIFGNKASRLLVNIGCVPVVIIGTLTLIFMFNIAGFWQAPSYVSDPASYVIGGRLVLSLGTAAALEGLATWVLGLAAALFGMRAAAGRGAYVAQRLRVIRRRVGIGAWAIIALRIVLLGVVLVGATYLFTRFLGFRLRWDFADDTAGLAYQYPLFLAGALIVIAVQWLIGPLLRLRYSLALGAMAGAMTRNRDRRPWVALSLRLGTELAGVVVMIWALTILRIVSGVLFDPVGYPSMPQYPDLFPMLPPRISGVALLLLSGAGLATVHTVLQLVLTQFATSWTRRKLAEPTIESFYTRAAASFKELAKTSAAKGEAT